ncbi:uncharacterized protein [Triticum aestivum]|uniref:uncharacterized protein isoform X1 n=1 Tax=Triticum aestivum TaxID=4565 RepID=UPI0008458AF6|nr:uncharacterized protein LOC123065984 isoform X1 [Triticum aestivum]
MRNFAAPASSSASSPGVNHDMIHLPRVRPHIYMRERTRSHLPSPTHKSRVPTQLVWRSAPSRSSSCLGISPAALVVIRAFFVNLPADKAETGRGRPATYIRRRLSWLTGCLRGTVSTRRRRSLYASTCATSSTAAAATSSASSPSSTSTPSTPCSSQVEPSIIYGFLRTYSALRHPASHLRTYAEIHERLCGGEGEPWFYFCARQEREARGGRPSRTTPSGYWKAAGTPGVVYSADRRPIGLRKTMVFYRGRAPSGTKTKWKMNEYRAFQHEHHDDGAGAPTATGGPHAAAPPVPNLPPQLRSEFSLCRLYTKSGTLRQFDRRPVAAAARGDIPGPSTAATASPGDGDGSGGSMQPLEEELMEGADGDPYGDDIATLAALLYSPTD